MGSGSKSKPVIIGPGTAVAAVWSATVLEGEDAAAYDELLARYLRSGKAGRYYR